MFIPCDVLGKNTEKHYLSIYLFGILIFFADLWVKFLAQMDANAGEVCGVLDQPLNSVGLLTQ